MIEIFLGLPKMRIFQVRIDGPTAPEIQGRFKYKNFRLFIKPKVVDLLICELVAVGDRN